MVEIDADWRVRSWKTVVNEPVSTRLQVYVCLCVNAVMACLVAGSVNENSVSEWKREGERELSEINVDQMISNIYSNLSKYSIGVFMKLNERKRWLGSFSPGKWATFSLFSGLVLSHFSSSETIKMFTRIFLSRYWWTTWLSSESNIFHFKITSSQSLHLELVWIKANVCPIFFCVSEWVCEWITKMFKIQIGEKMHLYSNGDEMQNRTYICVR